MVLLYCATNTLRRVNDMIVTERKQKTIMDKVTDLVKKYQMED
jgi:hypothetical protein